MVLDIPDLERRGERIGEARNLSKAEVFLVRDGDRPLVVKTLAHRPAVSRHLLGGLLLRREGRMLARLAGTPGVPHLVGATDRTLVVEWAPGKTLFQLRKKGIPPETAERIESVVRGVHARGYAHGDIGRRDVLVDRDGTVSLIDFATAVGPGSPPVLWRILLPLWKHRDMVRIGKMIRRYRRRWDKRLKAKADRRAAREGGSGAA